MDPTERDNLVLEAITIYLKDWQLRRDGKEAIEEDIRFTELVNMPEVKPIVAAFVRAYRDNT